MLALPEESVPKDVKEPPALKENIVVKSVLDFFF